MSEERITPVGSNVFVGSLEGAEDEELLLKLGISNILTVDIQQPRIPATLASFIIDITDEESSDLLSHLDDAVHFIEDCLRGGGGVLVHCRHGVSRSVTVTVAWLLHSAKVSSVPAALELVVRARPQAQPNPGFLRQLELYQRLNCEVHLSPSPLYINFALQHSSFQYLTDLSPPTPANSRTVRCSKCRKILTSRHLVLAHTQGEFPHWSCETPTTSICRLGLFVLDLSLLPGELRYQEKVWGEINKLGCRYCGNKIGNWGQASCGCGASGARGIWLNLSKVDV